MFPLSIDIFNWNLSHFWTYRCFNELSYSRLQVINTIASMLPAWISSLVADNGVTPPYSIYLTVEAPRNSFRDYAVIMWI